MENMFLIAGIISVIYFIGKFLEMRYLEEEPLPPKYLIRDTLLVYVSVVGGLFVADQLKPMLGGGNTATNVPVVQLAFTDDPSF